MQSVIKAFRVLEAVAERQPVGVGELARELELPKSTVQRCLLTLATTGWIRPVVGEPGRWALALRALTIGRRAEMTVSEAALGPMRLLRDEVNETIHLTVPDHSMDMVLVERLDCTQTVRTYKPLGTTIPAHTTATGRAVLALLPPEEVDAVIARGLRPRTAETVVDPEALRELLVEARANGYAVNARQNEANVCAVGAAVVDEKGRPVAAIAISMPAIRFRAEDVPRLGTLVRDAARRTSAELAGLARRPQG